MAEADALRVVVADDHPVVAEGLRRLFSTVPALEVVATVASVDAVLAVLRQAPIVDVVILDVDFPGVAGADTIRAISALGPAVVLFTHQGPSDYVASMIHAGARGFVSKSDRVDELIDALEAVRAGGEWLSSEVRAAVSRVRAAPPHTSLTEREHAVFVLLARGCTPKEIGYELDISSSTVYAHVERVRAKLGVATAADVERYAARWGLGGR